MKAIRDNNIDIDAARISAFGTLIREKLEADDTPSRKAYIRSVVSHIEVDDGSVRIVGTASALQAAMMGNPDPYGNVRGFVRKWRTRHDSNV